MNSFSTELYWYFVSNFPHLKLLIVEDEPALNESMRAFLHAADYICEPVTNYYEAIEKIELYDYDCIILDLMLPGGSGLKLLEYLKKNDKTEGVIIISAKDSLEDKIKGLQMGADDYLTKPFHLSELSVRVAAIIRRKHFHGQSFIIAGDISINTEGKSVKINGNTIDLTLKEYRLLLFFCINKNRVLSKNAIAQHLWGDNMDLADNYDFIYTHIKNIRKKILAVGGDDCIRSVYGAGYKMQVS